MTLGILLPSAQACPLTAGSPKHARQRRRDAFWGRSAKTQPWDQRQSGKLMCPVTAASICIRTNLLGSGEAVPGDSFSRQAYHLHLVSEIKVTSLLEKG